jgi:osmotically inducible protein OsmC
MAITNTATAHWTGTLKEGGGRLATGSGAVTGLPYDFRKRFEGAAGTNPEELVGAAHAACYAMFLSALMSGEGIAGIDVKATATVTLDPSTEGSPTVTKSHLDVVVKGAADGMAIIALAEKAKAACPISKLLNAEVSLSVKIG